MESLLIKRSSFYGIIALCAYVLSLTGCQTKKGTSTQPLITERHECLLKYFTHMTNEVNPMTITIDIPISGSQTLRDSLAVFLNEVLYAYYESSEDCHLPYESVFSEDVKQLAEHYRKAYAAFFQADTTDVHKFETDGLEINLAAQTGTYVTYEINRIFFGEGVEIEKEWVTFVKSSGHRLTEIISENAMLRFYYEQSELRNKDVWENILYRSHNRDSLYGVVCSVGLLNDTVAHQYIYAAGIFEDVKYPVHAIAPYLSREVQDLIYKTHHFKK